ncbi:MAG: sugar transferase [Candidatus Promineifilaceae bacterium]|nr:sugar transferase [Candidatus Promineifilaceae bacterium]
MSRRTVRNWTIITDIVLINLAFAFAYLVRYRFEWLFEATFYDPYRDYIGQQLLLTLLMIAIFYQNKVWRRRRGEFIIEEVSRVGYATATGIALMMAITFFFRPLAFSRLLLVWALLFIVLFIGAARVLRRIILRMRYGRGQSVDRAIIIGCGEAGRGVMRTLLARPDLGYQAIGYMDDGTEENNIGLGRIPRLGTFNDLPDLLQSRPTLHTVFIALPGQMHSEILNLVRLCQQFDVEAQVIPDLFQMSLHYVEFSNMAGIPLFSVRDVGMTPLEEMLKRALDLTIIALAALPSLAVGAMIAVAIKLESPGPIFYRASRIGQDGRPFKMIKFRSMVADAERYKAALLGMNEASGPIFKIRDDPRMTRVGRLIRQLSLDELPQLWNVLRGEMSLVGPRPPLPEEVDQYQSWHRRRLEVKGGLTGLWQVSGRSDLTFDEQCLLDIYYIENWSVAMDLRLILQTLPHLVHSKGAY